MAIDPNISLGFQQPKTPDLAQYMNMALTGQQLQNAQTQNQIGQAQLPGVQADSEIKQRAADFNKWITDNKDTYTNPDGTPNIEKFVNGASSAGYFKEAQATAGTDLTNKAAAIKNATDQQSQNITAANFTQSAINHAVNLIQNAPEDQRASLAQQYATFGDSKVPGTGQQILQTIGKQDPTTGAFVVDPAKLKAATQATMTPLQSATLGLDTTRVGMAQAEQEKQFSELGYTKQYQNPADPVNQQFRAMMTQAGQPQPEDMTLWKAHQLGIDKVLPQASVSQLIPTEVRTNAMVRAETAGARIQQLQEAITTAQNANTDLLGTRPGAIASGEFNKWAAIPAFGKLATQIQVHNSDPMYANDQIDPMKMTTGQIIAKLQGDVATTQAGMAGQRAVQNAVGLNNGPSGYNPSAPATPTPIPQGAAKYTQSYGTPADVLDRLQEKESSGKATALNPKSKAMGPYQFTPETLKTMTDKGFAFNPMDPQQSRAAADYYISQLVKQNGGDLGKAIQQYNGQTKNSPENDSYTSKITGLPIDKVPKFAAPAPAPTTPAATPNAPGTANTTSPKISGGTLKPGDIKKDGNGVSWIYKGGGPNNQANWQRAG